jgi:2',3'-cyclic-nucleotide 2'-phosphodiesterase (5'-nucleotidase family)
MGEYDYNTEKNKIANSSETKKLFSRITYLALQQRLSGKSFSWYSVIFYAIIAVMKLKLITRLFPVLLAVLLVLVASCNQGSNHSLTASPGKTTNISILHTNDIHGHVENMPRLATVVTRLRQEAGTDNTLLLDAGDSFAGSIYFQLYQGQASLWFLNYLGYDAMCPGNHDFDGGMETLANFVNGAKFHIISANLEFPSESMLHKTITPWVIVEKNGERYGIFGLLTEDTAEFLNPGTYFSITDHIAAARQAVAELEKAGINKIIALTHIGWNEDLELARDVGDIDIIIGGHSHTVPDVYPTVVDEDGSPTLVVQAGEYARYLGHLDVTFDGAGVVKSWTGSELLPIDNSIAEDASYAAKLAEYQAPIQKMVNTVVGKTLVDLDGARVDVRSGETNLGNLVADSMLYKAGCTGDGIGIIYGGGIRDSIPRGDITLGQVKSVLPFDDHLVAFDLTGEQIIAALENGVSQVEDVEGRFPQVAGLRFVWDPKAKPGNRIISIEIKRTSGYEPINPSATYRVVTTDYLYQGGEGYTMFSKGANYINFGYDDSESLAEYITAISPIDAKSEGRISRK